MYWVGPISGAILASLMMVVLFQLPAPLTEEAERPLGALQPSAPKDNLGVYGLSVSDIAQGGAADGGDGGDLGGGGGGQQQKNNGVPATKPGSGASDITAVDMTGAGVGTGGSSAYVVPRVRDPAVLPPPPGAAGGGGGAPRMGGGGA